MQYVELGSSGLHASILGFGCSGVMGRAGRRDSLRVLGAAYEAGITFFDTARSYGYGESEALLGEFISGRRDRVVISTKFGILPVRQQGWKRAVKPLARKVFSKFPAVKRAANSRIAAQFQHNLFTSDVLRQSLETSLRKLRTDHVDLLFMHTPPAGALAQDDLLCELENLVRAGKVRIAGVSSDPDLIASDLMRDSRLRAVQFPCNFLNWGKTRGIAGRGAEGRVIVANLPFGGTDGVASSRSRLRELANARGVNPELRMKLMSQDDGLLADSVLNVICRNSAVHVVVPSMMRMEHLRANVQAMVESRFSDGEIGWMRDALVTH